MTDTRSCPEIEQMKRIVKHENRMKDKLGNQLGNIRIEIPIETESRQSL